MENKISKFPIGIVAEGLAIIIAIGFTLSVIYDWGFFYALGIDFNFVPTTTRDHLRTCLLWLPYIFLIAIFYYALEFQFQRVERGLTEDELAESSSNPEKTKKLRKRPWKVIKWLGPLALINYILFGDIYSSSLPFALAMVWLIFAEWCYSAPLIQMRRSWLAQLAFTLLPIMFIFSFFSGYHKAVSNSLGNENHIKLIVKNKNSDINGNLLRNFERGVLLINKENKILFLPWKDINIIKKTKKYNPFQGALSNWFQTETSLIYNSTNSSEDDSND